MKIANVKGLVTKAALATAAAGVLLFAAPTKSQAQVVVGLRFGVPAPVVVAPAYPAPYVAPYAYYGRPGYVVDRDAWYRDHRFDRDHDWYRDHRFDRDHDRDRDRR